MRDRIHDRRWQILAGPVDRGVRRRRRQHCRQRRVADAGARHARVELRAAVDRRRLLAALRGSAPGRGRTRRTAWGARRVMQVALVAFGVFSFVAAHATNVTTLLTARALMGAAAAFIFPATLSLLTVTFRRRARARDGLRHLGRVAGGGHRGRPRARRCADRALLGRLDLLDQRADRRGRGGADRLGGARVARAQTGIAWTFSVSRLGTGGVTALVLRDHRGTVVGVASRRPRSGLFGAAVALLAGFVLYESRTRGAAAGRARLHRARLLRGRGGDRGVASSASSASSSSSPSTSSSCGATRRSRRACTRCRSPRSPWWRRRSARGSRVRLGTRGRRRAGLGIMGVALLWVAAIGASAPYFGPVSASMMPMALGFSLINAPSTAAIM